MYLLGIETIQCAVAYAGEFPWFPETPPEREREPNLTLPVTFMLNDGRLYIRCRSGCVLGWCIFVPLKNAFLDRSSRVQIMNIIIETFHTPETPFENSCIHH